MKPLIKTFNNTLLEEVSVEAELAELIEQENCVRRMLRNVAHQPLAMQRAVAVAVRNLDAKSVALEAALSRS
jgi:hypothetical protein